MPLDGTERAGDLTDRLFELGADLLVGLLPQYAAGKLVLSPQAHDHATFTAMISKDDGRLDWSLPAATLERAVRAYESVAGNMDLIPWATDESPGGLSCKVERRGGAGNSAPGE